MSLYRPFTLSLLLFFFFFFVFFFFHIFLFFSFFYFDACHFTTVPFPADVHGDDVYACGTCLAVVFVILL